MATIVAPRTHLEAPPTPTAARPFLTATWRDFLMLSYEIEPRVLEPFVPRGTELDRWHGRAVISLVGFQFCDARLFGVRIPLHQQFAEVNLRFYVRRRVGNKWRRGVVFLRELVGKRAVALVARLGYGERFLRVAMRADIERHAAERGDVHAAPTRIDFAWQHRGGSYTLGAALMSPKRPPEPDSLAEFVVDHYWAYTATRRGEAKEYLVVHPPWQISQATSAAFTGNAWQQYGPRFAPFLQGEPTSAFWANGSEVQVYPGRRL
jgi:uncharacterized protein YqjF (DUF2071 family)